MELRNILGYTAQVIVVYVAISVITFSVENFHLMTKTRLFTFLTHDVEI